MKKLFRWLFGVSFSLLLLVVLLVSVIIIFQIPLDLTRFKEPVEKLLSTGLNRPVRIEQSVVISTSLTPYLTIKGLKIDNPEGFETDNFLSMEMARIQVELMPLLKRKIHISEIQVQRLHLTLEERDDGDVNWLFTITEGSGTEPSAEMESPEKSTVPKAPGDLSGDTLIVRNLNLQDIKVDFHRPDLKEPESFHLRSCIGNMLPGQTMNLDIDGTVFTFDYTIDVSIGSLEELLTDNRSWMEIRAEIAETVLTFIGDVDLTTASRSLLLKTTVEGGNLASLSDLVRLDLPPFAAYKVAANLYLESGKIELKKLHIKTGTSLLDGTAIVRKEKDIFTAELKLQSPTIQLDDFIFENWSWSGEEEGGKDIEPSTKSKEQEPQKEADENRKLIDPELLARYQGSIEVDAEKVLSGGDMLGSGQLQAFLEAGRIRVNPLMVKLPGGKIALSASIKPGAESAEADLKVRIENFDIGILVNRTRPESDMGGLVNLDIDVESTAATIPELLANGNGYFDFSGKLENFGAGIIDLWAVNLVAAIVAGAEKEKSQLNCAVGRWSMTDGMLQSDAFFMDTSRIRICAEGSVNLRDQQVNIKVKPRAKRAEFFSLATPLKVEGSFSDINIGLGGGGVIGTAIKFVASPVTVPLKRTFSAKIPADGSDVCGMELGPDNRDDMIVPKCN